MFLADPAGLGGGVVTTTFTSYGALFWIGLIGVVSLVFYWLRTRTETGVDDEQADLMYRVAERSKTAGSGASKYWAWSALYGAMMIIFLFIDPSLDIFKGFAALLRSIADGSILWGGVSEEARDLPNLSEFYYYIEFMPELLILLWNFVVLSYAVIVLYWITMRWSINKTIRLS